MPMPDSTRPAMMPVRLEAVAASSAPPSRGMASSSKVVLRPSESARPLPPRLPTAAPASRLLTTCSRQHMLVKTCSKRRGPEGLLPGNMMALRLADRGRQALNFTALSLGFARNAKLSWRSGPLFISQLHSIATDTYPCRSMQEEQAFLRTYMLPWHVHIEKGAMRACEAYRALQSGIACKAQISSYGIQRSVDNPQMVAKGQGSKAGYDDSPDDRSKRSWLRRLGHVCRCRIASHWQIFPLTVWLIS